jgi:hypothetical protein
VGAQPAIDRLREPTSAVLWPRYQESRSVTTLVSLVGMIGRAIGGVLTTSLGWASSLLYGRIPTDHRKYVDLVMGAALLWLVLIVIVLLPGVGALLVSTTPVVNSLGHALLRSVILVGLVVLPAVVGLAGCFVPADENRPTGIAIPATVLRGYPLTVFVILAGLLLPVVGVARKIGNARRGWSDAHIAIVVKPGAYDRLVEDLRTTLARAGIETATHPAPAILLVPGRLLALLAGRNAEGLVPDRLVELRTADLEVTVYPSDIAISGKAEARLRARFILMTGLVTAAAHATTQAEAQKLEDRIERLLAERPATTAREAALSKIDASLTGLDIPTDDWDILFRLRIQTERDLLRG